jgi:hypothetical protein
VSKSNCEKALLSTPGVLLMWGSKLCESVTAKFDYLCTNTVRSVCLSRFFFLFACGRMGERKLKPRGEYQLIFSHFDCGSSLEPEQCV